SLISSDFFSCKHTSALGFCPALSRACEHYLYLGQTVTLVNKKNLKIKSNINRNLSPLIFKISSYFTIVLPIAALIGRTICRQKSFQNSDFELTTSNGDNIKFTENWNHNGKQLNIFKCPTFSERSWEHKNGFCSLKRLISTGDISVTSIEGESLIQLREVKVLKISSGACSLKELPDVFDQLPNLNTVTFSESIEDQRVQITRQMIDVLLKFEGTVNLTNVTLSHDVNQYLDNEIEVRQLANLPVPVIHRSQQAYALIRENKLPFDKLVKSLWLLAGKESLPKKEHFTKLSKIAEDDDNFYTMLFRMCKEAPGLNKDTDQKIRKQTAQMVLKALEEAEKDPIFLDSLLTCFNAAATSCGDRIALSIIYLDINYQIHKAKKQKNYKKFAELIIYGSWVSDTLQKIAYNKFKTLTGNVDEIETYLVYFIKIKQRIDRVPFQTRSMLYEACSNVSKEDINFAEKELKKTLQNNDEIYKILMKNLTWEKIVKEHPKFNAARTSRDDRTNKMTDQEGKVSDLGLNISNEEIKLNKNLKELTDQELRTIYSKIEESYHNELEEISRILLENEDLSLKQEACQVEEIPQEEIIIERVS
ncbi:MAG: NEL-type E3 ubiquitin ligase domain-containing protein, partial [Chlamydiota bacterium]